MLTSAPSLSAAAWKTLRAGNSFVVAEPARPDLPRLRRRSRRSAWIALAATGLGAAVLGLVGLPESGPAPKAAPVTSRPAPPPAAAPAWAEVVHPFTAYDLAGGPYAKLPLHYAARRDRAGEAREDLLTYGAPQPGQPFLRVAFLRRGGEAVTPTSLFLDAARLAAGAGLAVTRSGLGAHLDTRFGSFEVAGVAVEGRGRSAECLAFRLADPTAAPVLGLTGLACGSIEHPADAVTLACTIDRLDLVSAGDDEALRAVFVAAERRRQKNCAASIPVEFRLGAMGDPPGMRPLKEPL